ncbi:hypothetical protein AsAng_0012330 [Aureispira anguillae]|uniref:Uncharacterized protein n=1 Tax=Aureispira anguillae TaxID=2864201 RepID=A0A916DR97_9BACT|nr:hypothetical protein AsAng_0012330 [Aureispira anguillae]
MSQHSWVRVVKEPLFLIMVCALKLTQGIKIESKMLIY